MLGSGKMGGASGRLTKCSCEVASLNQKVIYIPSKEWWVVGRGVKLVAEWQTAAVRLVAVRQQWYIQNGIRKMDLDLYKRKGRNPYKIHLCI